VRRHAERALPHMSWFQNTRRGALPESTVPGESLSVPAKK
jgi:hypothetical protein